MLRSTLQLLGVVVVVGVCVGGVHMRWTATSSQPRAADASSLVNASRVSTPPDDVVAILALTRRHNEAARDAIRASWVPALGVRVAFVVGADCPRSEVTSTTTCRVKCASNEGRAIADAHIGDVVVVNVTDVYAHLPRKLKLAYRWALRHTRASWMVKVDEDMYVDAPVLRSALASYDPPRSRVVGCIMRAASVHRQGKWKELVYSNRTYPPFPLGSCGHAMTRDLVEYLALKDGFEYQGEDTSVGIWLVADGHVRWTNSRLFSNDGDCRRSAPVSRAVVGHDLTPSAQRACAQNRRTTL